MTNYEKYVAEQMKNDEFLKEYEALKPEFDIIQAMIDARQETGLTQKELAKQMGVSYSVFNEILNGKRPVTTEYALLLEAVLQTDANIWIGLQTQYNLQRVKQDKSFMKRLEKIRKVAAAL